MNRRCFAADHPTASILVSHGYAEHTGRYTDLIEALVARGYDVYAYDHLGHGSAPGKRAQADVGQLITDHRAMRETVREQMRTDDLFLFGHSMGGLVTAASALIDPRHLAGVVLSGPAFRPLPEVPGILAKIMHGLARSVPGLPTVKIDTATMSRDPRVIEAFEADEVSYHGKVPALTGSSMSLHGQKALDHATLWSFTLPLLVFHGTEDALAHIDGSREFIAAARLAGAPAALVEVPGAFHEVFNEPEAPHLREQMIGWLDEQARVAKTRYSGA